MTTIRCTYCGNEYPEGYEFCGMCGRPLHGPAPTPQLGSFLATAGEVFIQVIQLLFALFLIGTGIFLPLVIVSGAESTVGSRAVSAVQASQAYAGATTFLLGHITFVLSVIAVAQLYRRH